MAVAQRYMGTKVWKYGIATLSVVLALVITQGLHPTLFPTPLFFAAILISTWFGGMGPGLFAVALATVLLDYFFISSRPGFALHPAALLYLGQFSLPALLSSWFVKKRREAEVALREARDQLELKVEQRTSELRRTNEQLESEINERRRAEEAFHKIQLDLAHLTRVMTLSELATSIAHEVNQPLAAIVTNGDACLRWLGSEPPNVERARDAVARIIHEGRRASEVVKRIRSLSQKATPHRAPLHINELVREMIALLESELARNSVRLKTQLEPDVPPVLGDRVQLQQVVLNLIVNGIEAMSGVKGRPREMQIRTEKLSGEQIQISVKDCGCGLDPEHADDLFEAFVTTKPGGLGMGLSISRTIVEAHGGKLRASRNPDFGATFQFVLPTVEANEA